MPIASRRPYIAVDNPVAMPADRPVAVWALSRLVSTFETVVDIPLMVSSVWSSVSTSAARSSSTACVSAPIRSIGLLTPYAMKAKSTMPTMP